MFAGNVLNNHSDVGTQIALDIGVRLILCAFLFCLEAAGRLQATEQTSAVIPFEYHEGLLWIQVQVPESDRPLNFLFDTGASVSVINADTAAVLGLTGGDNIDVQAVNATTAGRWPVRMAAKSGNLALPSKYLSLDLSRLALSCGRPLDGLLGADFVQGRVVQINYETHQLCLLESAPKAANGDVTMTLKRHNDCYLVPATVNGQKRQWLRLDTGCASPLQWVETKSHASAKTTSPAIGLAGCLIPQTETSLRLGSEKFDHIPAGLHPRAIFVGEAGLLGNGLLTRFKTVTIDAKSMRLVLTPFPPARILP